MSLRIALLGLLVEAGPSSGYDLTKHFGLSTSNVWSAKHSQIYPELRKMEADGAVTAVEESGARNKRTYEITDGGRGELRRWLIETDPNRDVRSEACLRLFMLPLLDPEESLPLLRAEAAVYQVRVNRLKSLAESMDSDLNRYQATLGVLNMTALRDWATYVADDIERKAAEKRA
ncbi:PadR family transcriptional regulator [Phytomonospora sp. NPDC050363]|uniref:PadR family transcriptional regulator n=1 Tax=Phytomonospora sp. NPDC050363 TaxID=3155642 RepID=UPI0033C56B4C